MLLGGLVLGYLGCFQPVSVTVETYEIWPNSFRISNGLVELVVVPQVGRLMRFGMVGGRNLLWEGPRDAAGNPPSTGGWRNFGGDKVWPAPQSDWGWPPEREIDGAAWLVTPIKGGVRMRSIRPSQKLGVQLERELTLAPNSKTAKLVDRLINASPKAALFAVWDVCQVDDPLACVLPLQKSALHPNGWETYDPIDVTGLVKESSETVSIRRDPDRGIKYGSAASAGYVEAQFPDCVLRSSAPFVKGATYVDGGKAEQLYTSADPLKYAELEITGPLVQLKPQASTSLTVSLEIRPLAQR